MNGTAKFETLARNDASRNTRSSGDKMLQNKTIAETTKKKATKKKATEAKLKARGAAVVAAAIAAPLKDKAVKLTGDSAFVCKRDKTDKPVGNSDCGFWYKSMTVKGLPLHRPNLAMAIASGKPLEEILGLTNAMKGIAMAEGTPMGLALRVCKDAMVSKKHGYTLNLTEAVLSGKVNPNGTWAELHKQMKALK